MSWSHRLATLDSSPSIATIRPIRTSPTDNPSRSSPFERHLAKYRSLPLLWLRTCGSSDQQVKRRSIGETIERTTSNTSLGHLGEFRAEIWPSSWYFPRQEQEENVDNYLIENIFIVFHWCIHLRVLSSYLSCHARTMISRFVFYHKAHLIGLE